MASDPDNGPLIGLVTSSGPNEFEALVKEGSLTAGWNHEFADVNSVTLASDRVHGPLIGVLPFAGSNTSDAMVKEGSLTAAWNNEHSNVIQLAVAANTTAGHHTTATARRSPVPSAELKDLIATALFRDTDHLYRYLTVDLASLPGVRSAETVPILRTLKLTGLVA